MTSASPLLTSLVHTEFYARYYDTANRIAGYLGAESKIDLGELEAVHDSWKNEIFQYLTENPSAPNLEHFWIILLSSLAKALCGATCISYLMDEHESNLDEKARIRSLVMQYPNEYTGLEFIRSLHLEIYFSLANIVTVSSASLKHYDLRSLQEVLLSIKNDPKVAEQYASLLYLPMHP